MSHGDKDKVTQHMLVNTWHYKVVLSWNIVSAQQTVTIRIQTFRVNLGYWIFN